MDGQWYAFIIDQNGLIVGHYNPYIRGRDTSQLADPTGYSYGADLLAATESGLWVDYVITNPESAKNQQKHTWAVRHNNQIFASGWYE